MKLYQYTVTGRSFFPFDMLRYDSAYPRNGEAVDTLHALSIEDLEPERNIDLASHRTPTPGRWVSFGWEVSTVKTIKI